MLPLATCALASMFLRPSSVRRSAPFLAGRWVLLSHQDDAFYCSFFSQDKLFVGPPVVTLDRRHYKKVVGISHCSLSAVPYRSHSSVIFSEFGADGKKEEKRL